MPPTRGPAVSSIADGRPSNPWNLDALSLMDASAPATQDQGSPPVSSLFPGTPAAVNSASDAAAGAAVVYAVALSGSMFTALPVVKQELCIALRGLPADQRFQVIGFSEDVTFCSPNKHGMLPTPENLAAACSWVQKLDIQTSANTLSAINHLHTEQRAVAAVHLLTANYPTDPPKKILGKIAALQRAYTAAGRCFPPYHCTLFATDDAASSGLALGAARFNQKLAKATGGTFSPCSTATTAALREAHAVAAAEATAQGEHTARSAKADRKATAAARKAEHRSAAAARKAGRSTSAVAPAPAPSPGPAPGPAPAPAPAHTPAPADPPLIVVSHSEDGGGDTEGRPPSYVAARGEDVAAGRKGTAAVHEDIQSPRDVSLSPARPAVGPVNTLTERAVEDNCEGHHPLTDNHDDDDDGDDDQEDEGLAVTKTTTMSHTARFDDVSEGDRAMGTGTVYVHRPGTNLVYAGVCYDDELASVRQPGGGLAHGMSIDVMFAANSNYGTGRRVPCEKLIFELDRSRTPSPKLASVLVRMGEGFYQAGYASGFRRAGPTSTVSTKVNYVCTGETESVPAGSCVAVGDEHMEMIEIDADLEDTDYPLVDFSLPVPPSSGGYGGEYDGLGLDNQTVVYPTEFAPHASPLASAVTTVHHYYEELVEQTLSAPRGRGTKKPRPPLSRYPGSPVYIRGSSSSASDKEALRISAALERKEANIVYQHEHMRTSGPGRRKKAEARENKRLAKLKRANDQTENMANRKLLAARERLTRSFEAEHQVCLKHGATLKSKQDRQKQYDDLQKSRDRDAKQHRNNVFELKKIGTTMRLEQDVARKRDQVEDEDRRAEGARATYKARDLARVKSRVEQAAREQTLELGRRAAHAHRIMEVETGRDNERRGFANKMETRRNAEVLRRKRDSMRCKGALDDMARDQMAAQAAKNQRDDAKRQADMQREDDNNRAANRQMQSQMARRTRDEEKNLDFLNRTAGVAEGKRDKAKNRTELLNNRRREHEVSVRQKTDARMESQKARLAAQVRREDQVYLKETSRVEARRARQPQSYATIKERVHSDGVQQQAMQLDNVRTKEMARREGNEASRERAQRIAQVSLASTNARTVQAIIMERSFGDVC